MQDHNDNVKNSTEQHNITSEEGPLIADIWGLDESESSARVEDFRIRPHHIANGVADIGVVMRLGSDDGETYYIEANVHYEMGESHQHVRIHRKGGGFVDEFHSEIPGDLPSGTYNAVSAMHDIYVQHPAEWYSQALTADTAGD